MIFVADTMGLSSTTLAPKLPNSVK